MPGEGILGGARGRAEEQNPETRPALRLWPCGLLASLHTSSGSAWRRAPDAESRCRHAGRSRACPRRHLPRPDSWSPSSRQTAATTARNCLPTLFVLLQLSQANSLALIWKTTSGLSVSGGPTLWSRPAHAYASVFLFRLRPGPLSPSFGALRKLTPSVWGFCQGLKLILQNLEHFHFLKPEFKFQTSLSPLLRWGN